MSPSPSPTVDRIGGVAGLLAVCFLLLAVTTGEMPQPDHPVGTIAADIKAHGSGLLVGAYAGACMVLSLLVFGGSVVARLRRSEESAAWSVLAVIGVAGTSTWLIADAASVEVVRAVRHGVSGDALWVGYGLDHWIGTLALLPWAVFMLAASIGGRVTSSLPRWTSIVGVGAGALLIVGAASITGDELTGGPLGLPWFLGILLTVVWIVGASVGLLRVATRPAPRPATVATAVGR